MMPSSCAPLIAQTRRTRLGPDVRARVLCGTGFGAWLLWAYWEQVGRPKFAPDAYSLADPCSSEPVGGVLSLPQDQSSAHTCQIISFSCIGDSPGRREGLDSWAGEADVVNSWARPSWSKEEEKGRRGRFAQQGCASSICLRGEAVYSSLLLCGCAGCHILPLKGYKLTFSSRNVPFRRKQGKLCHYSNMCEPLVVCHGITSCMSSSSLVMVSLDTFQAHYPASLLEIELTFFCASRQCEVRK